jgi:hypothetical protein
MIRILDHYQKPGKRCNSEVTVRHVSLMDSVVPGRRTVTYPHSEIEPRGRLIRPYAVTGGRTEPSRDIAIEAVLTTTPRGRAEAPQVGGHKYRIAGMCDGRALSLAEIASYTRVPLGVARVLVADMTDEGLLYLHETDPLDGRGDWMNLLDDVLRGLRDL